MSKKMTKKDYILILSVLHEAYTKCKNDQESLMILSVAQMLENKLAREDDRFNHEKWYNAIVAGN